MPKPLPPAAPLPDPELVVGADGTARSGAVGDVYFSAEGGAAESRHVFLEGIGAPAVWRDRARFRVGELGFGTGLNFLTLWAAWRRTAPAAASLDVVAVEGMPADPGTLARALGAATAAEPELRDLARTLSAAWPPRVGGIHRRLFDDGRVRLTLVFDDVAAALCGLSGAVDAWFLDGFAPARNPAMWTPAVLGHVARLSTPGARLATFTVAGAVRRGLGDAGFRVEKRPGFGTKRECLAAVRDGAGADVPPALSAGAPIAVIGAGIAGASAARALGARGYRVTVIDDDEASGPRASANPAALIAPRLPRERTAPGRVLAQAYLFAVPHYDALAARGVPVWQGARGALALARDDDEAERHDRAVAAFGWPDEIMRPVTAAEAAALAGVAVDRPGLWFPGAGTLAPRAVTGALLDGSARHAGTVAGIERAADGWRLVAADGAGIGRYAAVVIAAGPAVAGLVPELRGAVRANRGQIGYLADGGRGPRVPLTYGGYLTSAVDLPSGARGHVIGATYARPGEVPAADWRAVRDADHDANRRTLAEALPTVAAGLADGTLGGRTALRATVRDYLPLVGTVRPGLYVLAGLGSRGFTTAPLLAEVLADTLVGAPPPLQPDLIAALDPLRFDAGP